MSKLEMNSVAEKVINWLENLDDIKSLETALNMDRESIVESAEFNRPTFVDEIKTVPSTPAICALDDELYETTQTIIEKIKKAYNDKLTELVRDDEIDEPFAYISELDSPAEIVLDEFKDEIKNKLDTSFTYSFNAGKVVHENECDKCNGTGHIPKFSHKNNGRCYACDGTGKAE